MHPLGFSKVGAYAYSVVIKSANYLHRRLASVCMCLSSEPRTARHISFGGEGNALYPVLSDFL